MTHGSLFSGIGGFDLAAEWAGWQNVMQCEINPFCRQVLQHYWPAVPLEGDITKTDFNKYHGTIDVISGGFPCQPFSHAGSRQGLSDSRYLWPEMYRAITEIQPAWVVGENVPGLLNWSKGLVFKQVKTDLEAAGYQVWTNVLPACSIGAPHRRERVFIVAYAEHLQRDAKRAKIIDRGQGWAARGIINGTTGQRAVTDPDGGIGQQGGDYQVRNEQKGGYPGANSPYSTGKNWENFPTESPVYSRNDGLSPRLAGITVPNRSGGFRSLNKTQAQGRHRQESINGYGNAVVPQLVLQLFRSINWYNEFLNQKI